MTNRGKIMSIKTSTVYKYEGVQHDRLQTIKNIVENEIGGVLDKTSNFHTFTSKQKLNLLEMLVENKEDIVRLLTVTYEQDSDLMSSTCANILDL